MQYKMERILYDEIYVNTIIHNDQRYIKMNDVCDKHHTDVETITKRKNMRECKNILDKKCQQLVIKIQKKEDLLGAKQTVSNYIGNYYIQEYSDEILKSILHGAEVKSNAYIQSIIQQQQETQQTMQQVQNNQQKDVLKDEQQYMQVQQKEQQTLYNYTIQQLKIKNVPEQMIQFFISRVSDELLFIDQTKAIEILQYSSKQEYLKAVKKGVLNQDVTIIQVNNGNNSIQKGQFEEKEKYNVSLNFLLKLLKKRDISKLNEESKKAVQLHLQYLELIEETHINYIKHVEQKSEVRIQDDASESQLGDELEELKQDSDGNLHNHNGQIVQHNQQLQVIQDQIYNINDLSLKQLYMILGKLECYNSNERQKKFLIQIVEMRIQLLEKDSQIELQKKDSQIEIQKKDNQIEMQKKDTEILQTKQQYELLLKDKEIELKNKEIELKDKELNKQNEMKKYLEESLKICQEWILYILYYVQEEIDIINDELLRLINTHVKNSTSQTTRQEQLTKCYQLLSEFLKNGFNRQQQKTDDINDMNDILNINNKDYLPFYIGICQQNRSQIRPYEHYDSVIKLLSYIDQSKNLYKYRELCKYLQQNGSNSKYFYQTKICTLSNTDKILRDIETKKIQQLMNNNPQITNKENYNKFRDGKKYKIIHDYLTENGLKKAGDIKF